MEQIKSLLMMSLFFLTSSAMAEEVKTAYDLDVLQSQTTYYKAMSARDKALDEVKNPASASNSNVAQVQQPVMNAGAVGNVPSAPVNLLPVVSKIIGGGSKVSATLAFSDGSEAIKRSGDMLPGGYQIISISISGVSVKNITTGKTQILSEGGR